MAKTKNILTFDTFRGCDFTNAGTDMDSDKSPNCVNMIRDVPGKIRKRMGYTFDNNYGAQINGYHYLQNEDLACIHAGTELYNVGGSKKSAYFKDYDGAHGEDGYLYAKVTLDGNEAPKTPEAFVSVGTSGYLSGKYDKLVGGNAITNMRAVCYGAGRFVAVGDSGKAYYSTDKGKTWEKMSGLDKAKHYYGVTYDKAQQLFIAVGTKAIYSCRDGINWYESDITKTLNYNFYGVCGAHNENGYALIVGNGAVATLKKGGSGDSVAVLAFSGVWRSCCIRESLGVGHFMICGDSSKVYGFHITEDATTHSYEAAGCSSSNYYSIIPYKDGFATVGTNGTLTLIRNDLSMWKTGYVNNEKYNLSGISFDGTYYVITTSNSYYAYYTKYLSDWKFTRLKVKYNNMQGVVAPIKEQDENYFKAKIYFADSTNIELLASTINTSDEDDNIRKLTFDLTNYQSHIKSAVMDFFLAGEAKIYSVVKLLASSVNSLYSGANDDRSISVPFNGKLYILDGNAMLQYDGYTVQDVSSIAYIPTLTISKLPNGGGEDFEALNLIQPGFTEMFLVKTSTTATNFQMTFGELDSTEVRAWVMNANGEWVRKYENTDFTVDRITGIVTFTSAIGASPIEGEDNVKITAFRTVDGYAERINKCTVACLFGVNGAQDRVFVSGNPDKKCLNYDWYSAQNDATYFGDTSYCTVGNSSSPVMGYAIVNNYLATFKGSGEMHQNVVIRSGNLVDSEPSFPLTNTLQGDAVIAKQSFQYLETEPVFLTKNGVMSITSQDITAEKYAQDRSFYLNGKLLKESAEDLANATSIVYNDMYMLAVNGKLYILDGIQPIQTDKSLPYATRQYAGFYCTNVPARVMWVDKDNVLWFGTDSGDVYKFYTDVDDLESYNDDGEPIEAIYETIDLGGKLFFKNKTFKYIAVRMGVALRTSMSIFARQNGVWNLIKKDSTSAGYFDFEGIDFSRLTFNTDNTPLSIITKMRIKKVDKTRIRLTNDALNEPFSIYDIGIEYTENGNRR